MWVSVTLAVGPDGRLRCGWALGAPEYLDYHDHEWGQPVTSVSGLFERLSLEAFQSGLAWITILRKREGFRAAFAGFQPERVARFGQADVERLMNDPGIVRNRAKIEATIANARVVEELGDEFARLILAHADRDRPRPVGEAVRATSPESVTMARQLKAVGIRFVGPTTAYALMQAVGLVDDHLDGCFVPLRSSIGPPKPVTNDKESREIPVVGDRFREVRREEEGQASASSLSSLA